MKFVKAASMVRLIVYYLIGQFPSVKLLLNEFTVICLVQPEIEHHFIREKVLDSTVVVVEM